MLQLTALLLVAQIQVPPPRGYANDFAAVLDSASVAHMEAVIAEVRDRGGVQHPGEVVHVAPRRRHLNLGNEQQRRELQHRREDTRAGTRPIP